MAGLLRCPVCTHTLAVADRGLGCPDGHRFDLARQGYVSLLAGRKSNHRSDTATMVAARRRVLDGGLYAPVLDAVAGQAAGTGAEVIVDAGCGTGHYLAAALDALPAARGIGIDLSPYCARAAAKVHPRAGAVVADLWAGLPVADAVAQTVLSVFAPRNARSVRRVLARDGHWILVTPDPGHLDGIREPMGMLGMAESKLDRLHAELREAGFTVEHAEPVRATVAAKAPQLADIAGMGPAGFHRSEDELSAAAKTLAPRGAVVQVPLAVTVTVARR